jgi:hypothetical protein
VDARQLSADAGFSRFGKLTRWVKANAAEQFKTTDPWTALMRWVSDKIAPTLGPFRPPDALPAPG